MTRSGESAGRLFFFVFLTTLGVDQLTKNFARAIEFPISVGLFRLVYTSNTGIAFSLIPGLPWIPSAAAVLALVAIVAYRKTIFKDKTKSVAFALIAGGALGNLIDRLAFGAVTDFIDLGWWPVFNIADSALTIAAVILLFYYWKK